VLSEGAERRPAVVDAVERQRLVRLGLARGPALHFVALVAFEADHPIDPLRPQAPLAERVVSHPSPTLGRMIRVFGSRISCYTGKLETYLRYRAIDYELLPTVGHYPEIRAGAGAVQMPVVRLEDARWMSDSTPTLAWFEAQRIVRRRGLSCQRQIEMSGALQSRDVGWGVPRRS